jgi:hypothetical protein
METICDPCSEKNKRLVAEKYCSDCEEKLCTECAEWHMRCMEYRSVINFFSMSSRYFRTFDLAALICFIINDFLCFSNR